MAVAHFEMWGFAFRSLMRKVADGSIRRAILLLAAMGVALLDAGSFTLVSGYGMSVRVRRRSTLLRTSEMDLPSSTSAGVGYDAGKL